MEEKSKKEKKRSSTNSSFLVTAKNKIHFGPAKTTPKIENRESSVAFSLFKKQFFKETVLHSPSIKECRKELLKRWSLLPEVEKNSFTLSLQQNHCICQKPTKKIIISWLVAMCVSSGIIQKV